MLAYINCLHLLVFVLTMYLSCCHRGEHLGWTGVLACISSIIGLLFVMHPPFLFGGHQDWSATRLLGTGVGVLAAFFSAAAFICIRNIGKSEPALVIAMWFHTATLVLSVIPLAAHWPQAPNMPAATDWGLLVGVGATSFAGQLLLTRGFQLENAAKASSVNFTQVCTFGLVLCCLVL